MRQEEKYLHISITLHRIQQPFINKFLVVRVKLHVLLLLNFRRLTSVTLLGSFSLYPCFIECGDTLNQDDPENPS